MWKSRPDEKPISSSPAQPSFTSAAMTPTLTPKAQKETAKSNDPFRADVAHIGKSVLIKGELSGSEDLYLDGEVEGTIDLREHSLVIGPNGRIRASVSARELVVHGRIEGNVRATERVELKKSSTLMGDVSTQRIVIEDGAFFKGAIDIPKEAKVETRKASVAIPHTSTPASVSLAPQGSFLEHK
jgi:cytoskeletal protein CcmA (bactofilin family)